MNRELLSSVVNKLLNERRDPESLVVHALRGAMPEATCGFQQQDELFAFRWTKTNGLYNNACSGTAVLQKIKQV